MALELQLSHNHSEDVMKLTRILPASLIAGLTLASPAPAQTTTFTVSATVSDACSTSATDLAFGAYTGTQLDSISTISVTCTLGTAYDIRLDDGANGSTVTTRQMIRSGGSEVLNYSLFSDTLRTTNWGETDATDTVSGLGTGLSIPHLVYGRIPASENVPAGSYSDTVTVTISY